MPRARRAGWVSVLAGVLGISLVGALTIVSTAGASQQPVVATSVTECSSTVGYEITAPAGADAARTNGRVGVWWRVGDVTGFTPGPGETPTVNSLTPANGFRFTGTIDTGAPPDSTVTLRVEALDAWGDGSAAGGPVWSTVKLPPSCEPPPEAAAPPSSPPADDPPGQTLQALDAAADAELAITKTANVSGPVAVDTPFTFTINYSCSSLTTPCEDATITDLIPPELAFVANTATSHPSTITYDAGTKTLTVVFTQNLGDGKIGLQPGTTGNFDVTVKFPAGTTNGTTANNCGVMTASNATQVQGCDDASAFVPQNFNISLAKSFTTPQTGLSATSGVQGTGPTTTVQLTGQVLGNVGATSLTVTDPSDATNPFQSFDLDSFQPVILPAGVKATVEVTTNGTTWVALQGSPYTNGQTPTLSGADPPKGNVVGVRVRYETVAANGTLPLNTNFTLKVTLKLRDTLRGSATPVPAGTISNCASATGTYTDHADVTVGQKCADYTVVPRTPSADGSKSFNPTSLVQKSGGSTKLTLNGKNASNIPASQLVITDPTNGSSPFNSFNLASFDAVSLPAGVTNVKVEVTSDNPNPGPLTWSTVGTFTNGQTPALPGSSGIGAANVTGVRLTYSGTIAAGQTLTQGINLTLRDQTRFAPVIDVPAQAYPTMNCETVDLTTSDGNASKNNICAAFTVTPIVKALDGSKSFNPTSGIAQSDPTTTLTISGKNAAASNAAITDLVVTDPGTTSDATFDYFDFVSFGAITVPAGTTWKVEVFDGSSWVTLPGGPYSNGNTPALTGSGVTAAQLQGVRYSLVSGSLNPNQEIRTSAVLKLRDNRRSDNAAIGGGVTITNRVDIESTGLTKVVKSATYTTTGASGGTPTISKSFSPSGSVVAGSGATKDVTLTGANKANVVVDELTLEDQAGPANTFWNYFDFTGFQSITIQAGIKLNVSVFDGSTWVVNATDYTGTTTPALPGGVSNAQVQGVRFKFTPIAGTEIAVERSLVGKFGTKLRADRRYAPQTPILGPDSAVNCASNTYDSPLIPTSTATTCQTVTISAVTYKVFREKTWSPATAVVNTQAQSTVRLTARNTSNVGIDQIQVVDPGAGSSAPFDKFDLVSFGSITLPTNVRASIEVSKVGTGGPWLALTGNPHSNGQTPSVAGSGANANEVVAIRLTYTATPGNTIPVSSGGSNSMVVPFTVQLRDTLRGTNPAQPVSAGQVQNCIDVTSTPAFSTLEGDHPCAIYAIQAESPGVSDAKTWSPSSGNRDELPASTITLQGRNSGNVPANSLTIQDPATVGVPALTGNAFDAVALTGFGSLTFPTGADRVQLDVLTADGVWHLGSPAATLPAIGSLPDGVAAANVIGARASFTKNGGGLLPPETDTSKNATLILNVKLRSALLSTSGAVPLGAINNCMKASVVTPFGSATAPDKCATYTVNAGSLTLVPSKTLDPPSPTSFNPGDVAIFKLQLKNTGSKNWVAPTIVDKFPATLEYDAVQPFPNGQFDFDPNGTTLTNNPVATPAAGQVTFQWGPGEYLAPGQTAYLYVALKITAGTPAGTQIKNIYGVTEAGGNFSCSPAATGSTTFVPGTKFCIEDETISVKQSRGLSSLKQVKGDAGTLPTNVVTPGGLCPDNAGYTYYPCVAHTSVNNTFPYKLDVTNSGNVAMKRAVVIDDLPHIGDTGVIVSQQRGTAWTPTFASGTVTVTGLPAGATAIVYYSNVHDPCTTPLTGGAWCGDWSTSSFGTATKAIGVDITYGTDLLDPAESFHLDWSMTAPAVSPPNGSIAWNSFAYTGLPSDQAQLLLPAEPRKVGIVLDNPSLTVKKLTDPKGEKGTFEFTLTAVAPTPPVTPPPNRSVTTPGQAATDPWTNLTPGGTYTLTETAQADWQAGAFTCVDTSNDDAPVTISPQGVITLPAGSDVECSLTNTKRPTISVKKLTKGGDGTFEFTLSGPRGFQLQAKQVETTGGAGEASFDPPFEPGATYTLVETGAPDEWISEFDNCTGTDDFKEVEVSGKLGVEFVAPSGGVVECTFQNTKRPTVEVLKSSTGGNGTFDFTLKGIDGAAGGSTETLDTAPSGSASFTWDQGLTPGGTYQLTEDPKDEWVSTLVGCTGTDGDAVSIDNGAQFVAPAGGTVQCSFTNAMRPTVTVNKTTSGGNGTFSFTLSGDGGSTKPLDTSQGSTVGWDNGLTPGGTYQLTEADAGSDWVSTFGGCNNATNVTPIANGVQFTAPAGANVACRFTNANRPTVKIAKSSTGGDGTFSFTLSGTGGSTQPVTTVSGSGSYTWSSGLAPGGSYDLTETPVAGWTAAFEGCIGAQDVTAIANGVRFTAPAGTDVVCTFENSKLPTIKVLKSSSGGDGTFSFTLDGPGGGPKSVTTDGGSGTATWGPDGLVVDADYTLTETVPGSWVSAFVECTNTTTGKEIGAALDRGVGVALPDVPAGAVIECLFTNAKRPVIKVLKSSSGGDGTFSFTLDGAGGSSKRVTTAQGSGSAAWGPEGLVPGGDYTLNEAVQDGWVSVFTGCVNTATVPATPIGAPVRAGVGVALPDVPAGAVIECSFTNTKRPVIKVLKSSSGGDGTFSFTLDGAGGSSKRVTTAQGSGSAAWGPEGLVPGGDYTLNEAVQDGWVSVFTGCVNTATVPATPIGEAVQEGVGVSLPDVPDGAVIECSFTNAKRPVIKVLKTTKGKDGTFQFTLAGPGGSTQPLDSANTNSVSWGPAGLEPGADYTLTEGTLPDWEQAFLSCVNTTDQGSAIGTPLVDQVGVALPDVPDGATIECSFTNSNKPTVQVTKSASGSAGTFEFTLAGQGGSTKEIAVGDGASNTATWNTGLKVDGQYTLTETGDPDWVQEFGGCTNLTTGQAIGQPIAEGVGVSFVAPAGARIICAFTNELRPTITVEKTVNGGDGVFEFTLEGIGGADVPPGSNPQQWDSALSNPSVEWLEGLTPNGTYALTESPLDGWAAEFTGCTFTVGDGAPSPIGTPQAGATGVTLADVPPGAAVVCEFTNTQDPRIVVEKRLNGVLTGGWDYALSLGEAQVGTQPVFLPQQSTSVNVTTGSDGRAEQTISPLPADDPRVAVRIDETLKPGAEFVGVACTATIGGATVDRAVTGFDLATQSMTVDVRAGEVVVCTFDNTVVGVSRAAVGVSGIRAVLPFTGSSAEILLKTSLWFLAAGFFLVAAARLSRRRVSTS